MGTKKAIWAAGPGLLLLLLWAVPVFADIYRYVDDNGVCHFTNIKTDGRYRLYIRTSRKNGSEYVKEYEGIIGQASTRFGVDSFLIKAVIKAESDFDHQAVSNKGAQGLMQLMPATAVEMDVEDSFNPEENIFGGTRYLSLLLKRFNNNKKLAIAAYNAGPQRVELNKKVPSIPETEVFVKQVMKYYRLYSAGNK